MFVLLDFDPRLSFTRLPSPLATDGATGPPGSQICPLVLLVRPLWLKGGMVGWRPAPTDLGEEQIQTSTWNLLPSPASSRTSAGPSPPLRAWNLPFCLL